MTVKYITASQLSVRRMFGPLRIPRCIGLKIYACTMTSTTTTMSTGAEKKFGSRNERIITGDKILTKDETEGYLSNYPTPFSAVGTYLIPFQRNCRNRNW